MCHKLAVVHLWAVADYVVSLHMIQLFSRVLQLSCVVFCQSGDADNCYFMLRFGPECCVDRPYDHMVELVDNGATSDEVMCFCTHVVRIDFTGWMT